MVDGACCVFLFVVLFFFRISRESSFPPAPGGGVRRPACLYMYISGPRERPLSPLVVTPGVCDSLSDSYSCATCV